MSRFVHVATSHLKASISKNKAFRNSYLCGVLKHSKINRCVVAGQWKKILATETISWTKKAWVQDLNLNWKVSAINDSTSDRVRLFPVPLRGRMDFPSLGGSAKDMWEVQDWSPTLGKDSRNEKGCGMPTLLWHYGFGIPSHGVD